MNDSARRPTWLLPSGVRALRLAGSTSVLALALSVGVARAREPEDCQLAWGQAVRSYLTQNRTKGPEDAVFSPACALEKQGKKAEARFEAAIIGVKALVPLDPKGCARFMESYMSSSRPKDVCDAAASGDEAQLRKLIKESIPAKGK